MNLRADFPLLAAQPNLCYLDSAATTHKPQCVLDAMGDFYKRSYSTVHRVVYPLAEQATQEYEQVRQQVAQFLNATPQEIVFTRGTTSALNLVARSLGSVVLKKGDVVLLPEIEHHSNLIPWQMICKERGATLRFIPVNDRGELILDGLEGLLRGVKIVTLAHISNVLGTFHPLEQIVSRSHKAGAYVVVDGAQSAAHMPIDVQALDVDFFAFSGHKLYGPTGVGVLFGKKELFEKMPPLEGGGAMVDTVGLESATFLPPPFRFEAGTPPIVEVIGLGAALGYLETHSVEHEQHLLSELISGLQKIPSVRIIGGAENMGALVSFVSEKMHPLDLATLLGLRGICIRSGHQCSQTAMARFGLTSVCRVSLGLYNTTSDVERFLITLREILSK